MPELRQSFWAAWSAARFAPPDKIEQGGAVIAIALVLSAVPERVFPYSRAGTSGTDAGLPAAWSVGFGTETNDFSEVIAAEAYRQLSPALKTKVTEILKSHPDYEKWEKSFTSESPNLDLPMFTFMRSSTWPDEIRRRGNQYDHPKWHFIDYPLKPPKFPVEPGPDPTDDAGPDVLRENVVFDWPFLHGLVILPRSVKQNSLP